MSGKKELEIIQIVSKEYEVIRIHPVILNDQIKWGYIDYAQCRIYIDSELSKQMQFVALMHEIDHGILYEQGSELAVDEKFVEANSNIWAQVIRDNF